MFCHWATSGAEMGRVSRFGAICLRAILMPLRMRMRAAPSSMPVSSAFRLCVPLRWWERLARWGHKGLFAMPPVLLKPGRTENCYSNSWYPMRVLQLST